MIVRRQYLIRVALALSFLLNVRAWVNQLQRHHQFLYHGRYGPHHWRTLRMNPIALLNSFHDEDDDINMVQDNRNNSHCLKVSEQSRLQVTDQRCNNNDRRQFLWSALVTTPIATLLAATARPLPASARGLVHFPCTTPLANSYHLMRVGTTLLEEDGTSLLFYPANCLVSGRYLTRNLINPSIPSSIVRNIEHQSNVSYGTYQMN
jgi:hypothetical protein